MTQTATAALEAKAQRLTYTNWRGETALRSIVPTGLRYGFSEWHPITQWLVLAFDTEKGEAREFALAGFGAVAAPAVAAMIVKASEFLGQAAIVIVAQEGEIAEQRAQLALVARRARKPFGRRLEPAA